MAKKEVKTDLWVYDLLKQANINSVSIPANTTVTAVINMRAPADAAFDGLVAKNNYTINFKRAAMVSEITATSPKTGDMSIPITFFALGGGSALAGLFAGRKKKTDRDE